jgi:hypothetical protein
VDARELGVPVAGSLHWMVGPGLVFGVLLLIGLFMRWAFSGPGGPEKRLRTRPPSPDDGLLTQVAAFSRREPALALRAVLSDAGIRSTIRFPEPRRAEVLVFPEDADRARLLAASFPAG